MSSILDALKKVEAEKARKSNPAPSSPQEAARQLMGRRSRDGELTLRLTPLKLGAMIAGAIVAFAAATAAVSLALSRPPAQVAELPLPQPAAALGVTAPGASIAGAPEIEPQPVAESESPRPEGASTAPAGPPKTAPPTEKPSVTPAKLRSTESETGRTRVAEAAAVPIEHAPTPKIETRELDVPLPEMPGANAANLPIEGAQRRALQPASEPEPAGGVARGAGEADSERALPSNLRYLPILSRGAQMRHNLQDLMINATRPKDAETPYGYALINMEKVYEGDMIGATPAKLLRVESYGIAIEVAPSGQRYFIAF